MIPQDELFPPGTTPCKCPARASCRRACATGGRIALEDAAYDDDEGGHRMGYCYQLHPAEPFEVPLDECEEAETPEAEVRGAREASHDGFTKRDRNTLNAIYDAAVLGKEPDDKRQSGVMRHKQVEFGAKLAVSQKLSANAAARRAIEAYADEQGAYTASEEESLARAIRRELGK
jgi:hypothetical protein